MLATKRAATAASKGVILIGREGDDTLIGGPGRDALYGGPGDDLLRGSPGPDLMVGNAGTDTVDYSALSAGITVDLASVEVSGGDATGDRLVGIERVIGTDHGDSMTGDDQDNRLDGRGGDDTLDGGAGTDTLVGGAGADVIRFGRTSGQDTVILAEKAAATDVIQLGADIAFDQLWYAQVGSDLAVSVLGSDATILVKDFYGTPPRRGISLRTEAGETLEAAGLEVLEAVLRGQTRPEASSKTLSADLRRQLDPVLRAVWGGRQAYRLGKETVVNADHVGGGQHVPTIAALSGGGYVVAWQDDSGRDGSRFGVFARRLDASGGRVGAEFQVNTYTNLFQEHPTATGLPDGGYVIAWTSSVQDEDDYGIYGQRYAANGSPAGSEFQINTHTAGYQVEPAITALADGGFLVAWTDRSGKDGSGHGVFAQRFAANGTRAGTEFQVNTSTSGYQYRPAVSDLAGGGFVIVWESDHQGGSGYGIFGQRYTADGSTVGPEFRANTYTSSAQDHATVTGLTGGGFVVIWESLGQDGSGEGVYGQVFNQDGQAAGSEFRVNSHTSLNQARPAVTALDDGGFMATWDSNGPDGSREGIYGQQFNADGTKAGEEFRINETTVSMQYQPAIATLADDSVAITWTDFSSGSSLDIYTRVLESPATNPIIGDGDGNVLSASGTAGTGPAPQIGTNGGDTLTGSGGDDSLVGGGGADRLRGSLGNDTLSGGAGSDILFGDQGHDSLSGDADSDTLLGGKGNDTLTGGAGADRYVFARGGAADSIDNADSAQTQDTLLFKSGIGHDQLWFARSGQDLVVSVIGTADTVTVADWYAGADNRHLTITTEDRKASLADIQVQALVTAMASHAPPALGTLTLSSTTHGSVETMIAASWQLGG